MNISTYLPSQFGFFQYISKIISVKLDAKISLKCRKKSFSLFSNAFHIFGNGPFDPHLAQAKASHFN